MGHPIVRNATGFAFEPLVLAGADGRALLVPLVKATFTIAPDATLAPAEAQAPVLPAGEFWGDPDASSYKYEPEVAFTKPATDVVLIAEAWARRRGERQTAVTFQLGPLKKVVRVTGDRHWERVLGIIRATDPQPFERIPLIWERAFGGWDRSDPDPLRHACDPRNPVGTGFHKSRVRFVEGISLPNLEDPRRPIRAWGDRPDPAGFGFVSPGWQPRAAYGGTYDATWARSVSPALPADFDPRFWNAAPEGLVAAGYLRGDEPTLVENATPEGSLAFRLPGIPPPPCRLELRGRRSFEVALRLDTVIVDAIGRSVHLLWRGSHPLPRGMEEVAAVRVGPDDKTGIEFEPRLDEDEDEGASSAASGAAPPTAAAAAPKAIPPATATPRS